MQPVKDTSLDMLKSPAAMAAREAFQEQVPLCIILSEQMRNGDDELRGFLSRLRTRSCTPADVDFINRHRVEKLTDPRVKVAVDGGALVICDKNDKRESIGRVLARRYAWRRKGVLEIYAAHDYRTANATPKNDARTDPRDVANVARAAAKATTRQQRRKVMPRPLTTAQREYIATKPMSSTGHLPRELMFYPSLPVVCTGNAAGGKSGGVRIGIANGNTGIIVRVLYDGPAGVEHGGVRRFDKPPVAVIVRLDRRRDEQLVEGLPKGCVLLFPKDSGAFKTSASKTDMTRAKRRNVPLEPRCSLTPFKAQGSEFKVVHMYTGSWPYVAWSRVHHGDDLLVVTPEPFTLAMLNAQPSPAEQATIKFMASCVPKHDRSVKLALSLMND